MANQELLSNTPIARNTDPESSHIAAREITYSGSRASQQIRVLEAVTNYPGNTSHELSFKIGMDRYQIARRLPELESNGFIQKGQLRKDRINDRMVVTWWPAL